MRPTTAKEQKARQHAEESLAKMSQQGKEDVQYLVNAWHRDGRDEASKKFIAMAQLRKWKLWEALAIKDTVRDLV